jgi:hypothetical protein
MELHLHSHMLLWHAQGQLHIFYVALVNRTLISFTTTNTFVMDLVRLLIEKSVNADSMNLFFPGHVKVCVSEMPVASCDNGVEFATSEKGNYENTKMTQGILL